MKDTCRLVLKENTDYEYEPQRLPDSVLYVDRAGVLIIKEELVDNGRIKKVTGKLPMNPCENKHWTQEEVDELPELTYYTSMVDGGYVGADGWYERLVIDKKLILIQKSIKNHNAASIGYSPEENKWYGWSHRAIHGFTIGDIVKEGDLTNSSGLVEEYRIQHPEEDHSLPVGFKALTLNDAKRMAIAFACAVG